MKIKLAHWFTRPNECTHGPQTWPWWRLFAVRHNGLPSVQRPSTGHRFWIYTRWWAYSVDVYFDRRCRTCWAYHPHKSCPARGDVH